MADPYTGEIDLFAFNYAPVNWSFADGSTMAISQNTALFALLGTYYGGNGQTTFQLPNLSERAACGQGQGPGLTDRVIGETFGTPAETLIVPEMPGHNHAWSLENGANPRTATPAAGSYLAAARPPAAIFLTGAPNVAFSPKTIAPQGGSLPHDNRQPYLALNACICLFGIFPSFN